MLYDEFVERLETIVWSMDDEDYLELVKNMDLNEADCVHEMSEFDYMLDGISPSDLLKLFNNNANEIDPYDEYFISSLCINSCGVCGGILSTFNDVRDKFDVDDVLRIIIETNCSYENEEIQELLDDFATLDETEALDKIIEALDNEEDVKLVIGETEYVVERKKTVEKEKTEE